MNRNEMWEKIDEERLRQQLFQIANLAGALIVEATAKSRIKQSNTLTEAIEVDKEIVKVFCEMFTETCENCFKKSADDVREVLGI